MPVPRALRRCSMIARLVAPLVLGLALAPTAAAKDKPDVLVIVWDTTRADHVRAPRRRRGPAAGNGAGAPGPPGGVQIFD